MNSDANIATHRSIGPNVNGQTSVVSFRFFSSIWWITDDRLVICVV